MSVLEPLSWSSVHVIVAEVLRHVHSLKDLKSCRLVSKLWQTVADRFFYKPRKLKVRFPLRLSDNDDDTHRSGSSSLAVTKRHAISTWQGNLEAFGGFVTGWCQRPFPYKFPINHLVIQNENRLAPDTYQKICLDLLSEVGHTLTTLDIRFSSGNARKDIFFFRNILQKAPSLTELCINLPMWRTKGRNFGLPQPNTPDPNNPKYPSLTKLKVNILLGLFPPFEDKIKVTSLIYSAEYVNGNAVRLAMAPESEPHFKMVRDMCKHYLYLMYLTNPFTNLEALSITSDNSPVGLLTWLQAGLIYGVGYHSLKELHLEPLECLSSIHLAIMIPLTKLSLWYPEYSLAFYLPGFDNHAETLRDLEIKFQPGYKGRRLGVGELPLFPALEKLAYKLKSSSSEEEENGRSFDYDFFNLEKFFRIRSHEFSTTFPVLTEMVLELGRWKHYDQLVPKRKLGNPRLRQVLKVRATLDERDKEEFEETLKKRLYSLFPNASQDVVIVPDAY